MEKEYIKHPFMSKKYELYHRKGSQHNGDGFNNLYLDSSPSCERNSRLNFDQNHHQLDRLHQHKQLNQLDKINNFKHFLVKRDSRHGQCGQQRYAKGNKYQEEQEADYHVHQYQGKETHQKRPLQQKPRQQHLQNQQPQIPINTAVKQTKYNSKPGSQPPQIPQPKQQQQQFNIISCKTDPNPTINKTHKRILNQSPQAHPEISPSQKAKLLDKKMNSIIQNKRKSISQRVHRQKVIKSLQSQKPSSQSPPQQYPPLHNFHYKKQKPNKNDDTNEKQNKNSCIYFDKSAGTRVSKVNVNRHHQLQVYLNQQQQQKGLEQIVKEPYFGNNYCHFDIGQKQLNHDDITHKLLMKKIKSNQGQNQGQGQGLGQQDQESKISQPQIGEDVKTNNNNKKKNLNNQTEPHQSHYQPPKRQFQEVCLSRKRPSSKKIQRMVSPIIVNRQSPPSNSFTIKENKQYKLNKQNRLNKENKQKQKQKQKLIQPQRQSQQKRQDSQFDSFVQVVSNTAAASASGSSPKFPSPLARLPKTYKLSRIIEQAKVGKMEQARQRAQPGVEIVTNTPNSKVSANQQQSQRQQSQQQPQQSQQPLHTKPLQCQGQNNDQSQYLNQHQRDDQKIYSKTHLPGADTNSKQKLLQTLSIQIDLCQSVLIQSQRKILPHRPQRKLSKKGQLIKKAQSNDQQPQNNEALQMVNRQRIQLTQQKQSKQPYELQLSSNVGKNQNQGQGQSTRKKTNSIKAIRNYYLSLKHTPSKQPNDQDCCQQMGVSQPAVNQNRFDQPKTQTESSQKFQQFTPFASVQNKETTIQSAIPQKRHKSSSTTKKNKQGSMASVVKDCKTHKINWGKISMKSNKSKGKKVPASQQQCQQKALYMMAFKQNTSSCKQNRNKSSIALKSKKKGESTDNHHQRKQKRGVTFFMKEQQRLEQSRKASNKQNMLSDENKPPNRLSQNSFEEHLLNLNNSSKLNLKRSDQKRQKTYGENQDHSVIAEQQQQNHDQYVFSGSKSMIMFDDPGLSMILCKNMLATQKSGNQSYVNERNVESWGKKGSEARKGDINSNCNSKQYNALSKFSKQKEGQQLMMTNFQQGPLGSLQQLYYELKSFKSIKGDALPQQQQNEQ